MAVRKHGVGANGNEFHTLQLVRSEDWSSLTWTAETNEAGTAPIDTPVVPIDVVQQFIPALQSFERDVQDTQTAFLGIDGTINLVAVSRVQPWGKTTDVPPENFPLNVFTLQLDNAFLTDLAETYLLKEMVLSPADLTGRMAIPLKGPDGTVLTKLQWLPPRPGDTLVRTAIVPLTAGLVVFLIISGTVTILARRNARKLVESEAEAVRVARRDTLSGLPNRLAFNEYLAETRKRGGHICILMIDLNGFKTINDQYGHNVGDAFLKRFADLIRDSLPENVFGGRLGGDEFAVVTHGKDAEKVCRSICDALQQKTRDPIRIDRLALEVRYALGYGVGDAEKLGKSELLRQADIAMYHAKQGKKGVPVKYDPVLERDKMDEARTIAALKSALETCDEFDVVYQPIIDTKTGKLELAEALLRWHSPELGTVSPAYFIPIAERTPLIMDIGRFVMQRVFSDMAELPSLEVSINLSPMQLRSYNIVTEISKLSDRYRIEPSRVTFEITETTLLQDENQVMFITDALRDSGFKIAIDDFGTGYSSIGYLRKIHFDKLKVDKSFVDDIGTTETGENLLTSLSFLARALGLEIVAEGVETENQVDLLTRLSFDLLQGHFFSRPISADELSTMLEEGRNWAPHFPKLDAA